MITNSRGGTLHLDERIMAVLGRLEVLPEVASTTENDRHERRQNVEQGMARSAITDDDFHRIARDDLAETASLKAARYWVRCAFHGQPTRNGKPCPRFLVLHGNRGVGKTVAAAWAIANEVGYYVTAGEYRRQRYSYTPLDVERRQRAQTGKLVVLDDLGYESLMPERDEEWLYELINERQGHNRYTIVTTNEHPSKWFHTRYGSRVFDRLEHQGLVVHVMGMNLRRRWTEVG